MLRCLYESEFGRPYLPYPFVELVGEVFLMASGTAKWHGDSRVTVVSPLGEVMTPGTAVEVKALSNVEQLVAQGTSRLTAERIVAIERGDAEPGRARPHTQARR